MKLLILILEGWIFYSCFWRLKVYAFIFGGWMFLFLFLEVEGLWFMFREIFIYIYYRKMVWKNLPFSFIFLKNWLVKCNLYWRGICERWSFKNDNHVVAFVCVFEHLNFWGDWSWNKTSLFKHTCFFFHLWLLLLFCVIGPNFNNFWSIKIKVVDTR